MAGLLTPEEVQDLVNRLQRHKQTRRLAALCVRNAEALPPRVVDAFIAWIRQRILRFALFPEGLANILISLLTIVMFAFFWNVDLIFIPTSVALTISRLTPAYPSQMLQLIASFITSGIAVAMWIVLHRTYRLAEIPRAWRLFDRGLVVLVAAPQLMLAFGVARDSLGVAVGLLSAMAFSALLIRLVYMVAGPIASWTNVRIEEYIVNRHLIPYLEILRDMGPSATSAIIELQEELAKNRYMSERIKDAVERTWALSPRTALQVIEEIDILTRQAEAVKVLEPVILKVETESTIREQAVAALFHIVEQATTVGAVLGAIDALGRLALEQAIYRDQVIALLKRTVSEMEYPLNVRRRAWRALCELDLRDIPWPRPTLRESLRIWLLVAIFLVIILFVLWAIRFFL